MRHRFILIALLLLAPLPALAGAGRLAWSDDYAAARQNALDTNRPLYLVFTGSDWCAWCKKLDAELLDDPRVKEMLGSSFVPVRFDDLRRTKQPLQQRRRYRAMARRFEVDAVPAVLVVDPRDESVLLRHAYLDVPAERYIETLVRFRSLHAPGDELGPKILEHISEDRTPIDEEK
jgi:protein disulfide-isomerase